MLCYRRLMDDDQTAQPGIFVSRGSVSSRAHYPSSANHRDSSGLTRSLALSFSRVAAARRIPVLPHVLQRNSGFLARAGHARGNDRRPSGRAVSLSCAGLNSRLLKKAFSTAGALTLVSPEAGEKIRKEASFTQGVESLLIAILGFPGFFNTLLEAVRDASTSFALLRVTVSADRASAQSLLRPTSNS